MRERENRMNLFFGINKNRQTPTSTEDFFTFQTDAVCLSNPGSLLYFE